MFAVAITTFEGDVSVYGGYAFRLLVFVGRFFYSEDTAWLRQWFRLA